MRALLLTFAALTVAACDSAGDPAPDDLVVSLVEFEPPEGGAAELFVRVETEEEFPCANYQLRVEATADDERLRAEVGGVDLPGEICLTALGPATWTAPLDAAGDLDGYRVEVACGGRTDVYEVLAGASGLDLAPVRTSFTRPGPR